MGGLLANARKFFQGLTPASVSASQPYRITCHCGQRLSGDRTSSYQALRCPACGAGLFVLPRSPLPEPVEAKARDGANGKAASTKSARIDESPIALTDIPTPREEDPGEDEIQWVDEEAVDDAPEPGNQNAVDPVELAMADQSGVNDGAKAQNRPKKARSRSQSSNKSDGTSVNRQAPELALPRPTLSQFLWEHRNSLALSMVAVVVFGTMTLRTLRSRWEQLPAVAELGRVEGLTALDEGHFDKANQLLSEARRAVEQLGDAYQGAEAIRQGAKEAAIISKLVSAGLEELLQEASQSEADEWRNKFERLYQGQTVILQAQITSVPDGRGGGEYGLDYRVLPEGEGGNPKTEATIDTRAFRLFEMTTPKVGDTVTFGAKLASFQFDLNRGHWLIGLDPDSGVTMTHVKALEALGWPREDDTSGLESAN